MRTNTAPILDNSGHEADPLSAWVPIDGSPHIPNMILKPERAVLMQRGPQLRAVDLALPVASAPAWSPVMPLAGVSPDPSAGPTSLEALERQHLLDALEANGWNVSLAARALQITRDTLRYRMAKHGLQRGLAH